MLAVTGASKAAVQSIEKAGGSIKVKQVAEEQPAA
jgi:ribosomal protein L15